METIACNRAFVRTVRNFLGIHIVGDDEVDKSGGFSNPAAGESNVPVSGATADISLSNILRSTVKNKLGCGSFEDFKNKLRSFWKDGIYKNDEVSEWEDFTDIPAKEIRKLLVIIKKQ